jgi:hypothetical protein
VPPYAPPPCRPLLQDLGVRVKSWGDKDWVLDLGFRATGLRLGV